MVRRAGARPRTRLQRGGTLLGLLVGLILGLGIAVAVALFVTKATVPFVNKPARAPVTITLRTKGLAGDQ